MSKHKKHPKVSRPRSGQYHRCEIGLYGTTCSGMEALYAEMRSKLDHRLIYIDADHDQELDGSLLQVGKKQLNKEDNYWSSYDDRIATSAADAVIVNGNHYPANQQIILLDESKKDSLYRRLDQLTDVLAVVTNDVEIYDFLEDRITDKTNTFRKADDDFYNWLDSHVAAQLPKVKALILAGGRSTRMGEDKSQIHYHDQPHELYTADLCAELGLDTHISKAHDYREDRVGDYPVIRDRMVDMGPLGAIITAMMYDVESAWLVIACDLPNINKQTLTELISSRDTTKYATSYRVSDDAFPEPLISIYEPRSYARILAFLAQGYTCPRKVLINSDIKSITMNDASIATNANTQEERKEAVKQISRG